MVAVMGMLMISTMMSVAAFAAANNDIPVTRHDQDAKRAYSAAEAGVAWYLYHLTQDNAFWTYCANGAPQGQPSPNPNPLGQPGTLNFVNVPGSQEQYAIELVAQNGNTSCSTSNAAATMIDNSSGAMQIRVTGRSNGVDRTLVATLRRAGFLDYLYFTNYETIDPSLYNPGVNCAVYRRAGRSSNCTNIVFANGDVVNGPLHTNDDLLMCGSPSFGRTASDSIEVSAPPQGWSENGCSGAPRFNGTYRTNSAILSMPATNSQLAQIAQPPYVFTGKTTIVLSSGSIQVNGVTMNYPSNGVIYVQNGSCGQSYQVIQKYNDPSGCADVYVKGTYSQSLTIASAGDIIATGSILHSGNVTLGLIPNNFIRVYHPVSFDSSNNCQGNSTGPFGSSPGNIEIDAAILSLNHSFLVDNWSCGSPLGTLTVLGAIAQNFRGPVGTNSNGTIATGYLKSYTYDDRLKLVSPPSFLDPVQAAWQLGRQTEQTPAR